MPAASPPRQLQEGLASFLLDLTRRRRKNRSVRCRVQGSFAFPVLSGEWLLCCAWQHSMEFVNLKPTVRWRAAILPTHMEKPISSHPSPRPLGNPKIIKPGEKKESKIKKIPNIKLSRELPPMKLSTRRYLDCVCPSQTQGN